MKTTMLRIVAAMGVAAFLLATASHGQALGETCPTWRWIGVKTGGADCPLPDSPETAGWTVRLLFETADAVSQVADDTRPSLRDFCLYEHSGPGVVDDLPDAVRESGQLSALARDCFAVSAMASPSLTELVWTGMQKTFRQQAGRTPLANASAERVRLAFLDTSATREDGQLVPGNSLHGYTLTHLARDLLCGEAGADDSGCAAQITTRLALPIVSLDPSRPGRTVTDLHRGGFRGSLGQLAEALNDELTQWASTAPRTGQHLVLNLSLAWSEQEGLGDPGAGFGQMTGPLQAVYRALEEAACRGALVVAAAGNRDACEEAANGPLWPAAWAEQWVSCRSSGHSGPLLSAAGSVDASGAPLANARGGTPPLVAYGDHAVTWDPGLSQPTAIYTGTSVSAAVISSAAAVAWQYRGKLGRQQVMDLLSRSGKDFADPADPGGLTPPVRRISVCQALLAACTAGDSHCPAGVLCKPWSPELPVLELHAFHAETLQVGSLRPASLGGIPRSELCRQKRPTLQGSSGPYTGPTPQNVPCPPCSMGSDALESLAPAAAGNTSCPGVAHPYTLYLEIDRGPYDWGELQGAYLKVGDAEPYFIPRTLTPGDRLKFMCIDGGALQRGSDRSVMLTFLTSHGLVGNPVFLAR